MKGTSFVQLKNDSIRMFSTNKHIQNIETEKINFVKRKYLRHYTPEIMQDLQTKQILGRTIKELNK